MSDLSPKNMLRTVMEDVNSFLRGRGKDTVEYDTRLLRPDQEVFDYLQEQVIPRFDHDVELKRAVVGVMMNSVKRFEGEHQRRADQISAQSLMGVRR